MVSHVTCPVYAGLTDFDAYRSEQAEWLRQLVRTREYRKARYRIAISHFPMVMAQQWKDENVSILQERFYSHYTEDLILYSENNNYPDYLTKYDMTLKGFVGWAYLPNN